MKMADFCGAIWSGKEDSNLRPLPPEDVAPDVTRRISVVLSRTDGAHGAVCSSLVHAKGSIRTFGPCLMTEVAR